MKVEYMNIRDIINLPIMAEGESAFVFRDRDCVIKIYKPGYLQMEKMIGINTERKMINAKKIEELPEVEIPVSIIFDVVTGNFIGTRSRYIKGVNYVQFTTSKRDDYECIINCHDKFEDVLKRADRVGVVFPDFASCDNIIITNNDRKDPNIRFIDYDGIQVGKDQTMSISSSLLSNDPSEVKVGELIFSNKYMKDCLFTTELNIYSQYVLFFLDMLNCDITKIGQSSSLGVMTFDMFFETIGLDDYDLQNKIWKLFQANKKNEYLEDDKYTIMDRYDIEVMGRFNDIDIKKLVRKK